VEADANMESRRGRPVLTVLEDLEGNDDVGIIDELVKSFPPKATKRDSTDIFDVEATSREATGCSLAKSLSSSEMFPFVWGWE